MTTKRIRKAVDVTIRWSRGFYGSPEGIKGVEACTEPVKDHAFTTVWMSLGLRAVSWHMTSRDLDQTRPLGMFTVPTAREILW